MATFNLDKFRYVRRSPGLSASATDAVTVIAESPERESAFTSPFSSKLDHEKHTHRVVSEEKPCRQRICLSSSEDECCQRRRRKRKRRNAGQGETNQNDEKTERGEEMPKLGKKLLSLQKMFPESSLEKLEKVLKQASTLDGAIALLMLSGFRRKHMGKKNLSECSSSSPIAACKRARRPQVLNSDTGSEDEVVEVTSPNMKHRRRGDTEQVVLAQRAREKLSKFHNGFASPSTMNRGTGNFQRHPRPTTPPTSPTWLTAHSVHSRKSVPDPSSDSSESSPPPLRNWKGSSRSVRLKVVETESEEENKEEEEEEEENMMNEERKIVFEEKAEEDQQEEEEEDTNEVEEEGMEDYDEDLCESPEQETPANTLDFIASASLKELCLLPRVTMEVAQKIIALKPFSHQKYLKSALDNLGLPVVAVLDGVYRLLAERRALNDVMANCAAIASTTRGLVTRLLKNDQTLSQDVECDGLLQQPKLLNTKLRLKPYQLLGLNWLSLLHKQDVNAILGDEMGLGKTVQAIAFLAHLIEEGEEGPHLVVVTASTLANWQREFDSWSTDLEVLVYYGNQPERRMLRCEILDKIERPNVILTTYQCVIGTKEDRGLFRRLHLGCAVFDEGHVLKNMATQRYRLLTALRARWRLLLTGTPVQNSLLELLSLLRFIMPTVFSGPDLTRVFQQKCDANWERAQVDRARQLVQPFILRRLKTEVLEQLPVKLEEVKFCTMTNSQKNLYLILLQKLAEKPVAGKKREFSNTLMQLRKMANHPLLHRFHYQRHLLTNLALLLTKEPDYQGNSQVEIEESLLLMNDFEIHSLCMEHPALVKLSLPPSHLFDSGKFQYLYSCLPILHGKGERVALFSQFTSMLNLLACLLSDLHLRFLRLDGSTPVAERQELLDQFMEDTDIFAFLLSTRAGGLGLNLTAASTVIIHDPDPNPHNDEQAAARVHRLGQTRPVRVLRLITTETVEENIEMHGRHKLNLQQELDNDDISLEVISMLKRTLQS